VCSGPKGRIDVVVGARKTPLSQAQVKEVESLLQQEGRKVCFVPKWVETIGDLDQTTSLRFMEKTDFFTREIDLAVLQGECQVAIHSAKDLPEKLTSGLQVVAYTVGIDPSDVLVLPEGKTIQDLPVKARIGTSSLRREENLRAFLPKEFNGVDIRGSIEKRLALLDQGDLDGVVIARAALIRLKIERNEVFIPGEPCPMQGRLAVVARVGDMAMKELFVCLHASFT
jgi:hydroxymethylbilane synthase